MLCNLSSVEERPIVLLLHACRRLLGPTQLDDQVPDTQLWLCFWHKNMRHCSHGLNPAGNFRDNHTECYKDMLLLLNIRLASKFLFWGPSYSKIPVTKLWRCIALLTTGQCWWDSSVTFIYDIIYMHPITEFLLYSARWLTYIKNAQNTMTHSQHQ